jgi:hypothetical protein
VSTNWKQHRERSEAAKKRERILEAPEDSHCALLESQAQQFRHIEMENYQSLQRMLKLEITKAVTEVNNKKIMGRHGELDQINENNKQERKAMKDAAIQEEIERQRKKEEDFQIETKRLQNIDGERARVAAEEGARKVLSDKLFRERREADRLAREDVRLNL